MVQQRTASMEPTDQSSLAEGNSPEFIHLRLFIAGDSPNSRRAVANLKSICEQYLQTSDRVDYVDVWLQPGRGFAEGALVTPTLRRLRPKPEVNIIGDLSDTETVLLALGLLP